MAKRYAQSGFDLKPKRRWGGFVLAGVMVLFGGATIAAVVHSLNEKKPVPIESGPVLTPAVPIVSEYQPTAVSLPEAKADEPRKRKQPLPGDRDYVPSVSADTFGGQQPMPNPMFAPDTVGREWVKGYTKKDGTKVEGYYRKK